MNKGIIKIVIADDHDLIRQGIMRIISFEEDLQVIGEADSGNELLNMLISHKPDVVILDINMPLVSGIEVLKKIKDENKDIKVIMVTVEKYRDIIIAAIDIGADGYVLKDSAGTEIVNAIRTVMDGEKYIDRSLVSMLFASINDKSSIKSSVLDQLPKRELEVLYKISQGLSNKEIGKHLYISEKTVKNYASNLFRKINVNDRVQATIFALKNDIENYYKLNSSKE